MRHAGPEPDSAGEGCRIAVRRDRHNPCHNLAGYKRYVIRTERWPSGRRHSPAKGAYGPKPVSRVRIPLSPPSKHLTPFQIPPPTPRVAAPGIVFRPFWRREAFQRISFTTGGTW